MQGNLKNSSIMQCWELIYSPTEDACAACKRSGTKIAKYAILVPTVAKPSVGEFLTLRLWRGGVYSGKRAGYWFITNIILKCEYTNMGYPGNWY